MFSINTAEIRWFLPGSMPGNLVDWLQQQNGVYDDQPPRTDVYMVLPQQDMLGIKLREGRLELKKRIIQHEAYNAEGIGGKIESWKKWSIMAADGVSPGTMYFQDAAHWISIQKNRFLQKYEVSETGGLMPHPQTGYPASGIAVELSELTLMENTWWTFGLECFGNTGNNHKVLIHSIPSLISGFPASGLTRASSAGYPEWINQQLQ